MNARDPNAPEDSYDVPAYLTAADNHNNLSGGFSLTSPSTWSELPPSVAKFAAASVVSGANSIYNSGVTVANWFGAEAELSDTGAAIANLDSDLGEYYKEHNQGIDLAGFVVGSFVPGMAGVKILNAGQKALSLASKTGIVGTNLSKATGLLVPATDIYRSAAIAEIAQGSATFGNITGNTLKAVAAGYGQAALESAAFEVAVAATMYNSPVLSDADGWDIAKNIAIGTGVGGIIGGAISHAVTMGGIKQGVKAVNPAEKFYTATGDILSTDSKAAMTPSQKIMYAQSRIEAMPESYTAQQFLSGDVPEVFTGVKAAIDNLPGSERAAAAAGFERKFAKLRGDQLSTLEGNIRESFQALTRRGDPEFANQISDLAVHMGELQGSANFEHLVEIRRVNQPMAVEKAIRKDLSKPFDLDGELPKSFNMQVGYVKLQGEGAGSVTFGEAPAVLSVADTAKNVADVTKQMGAMRFRDGKIWTALRDDITHREVELRGLWVDKHAVIQDGMMIGEHDIPLLEKASNIFNKSAEVIDPTTGLVKTPVIKLVGADGKSIQEINTAEDLMKHLQLAKDEIIDRFTGTATGARSTEEVAKLANTTQSYIEGTLSTDRAKDLFARQMQKEEWIAKLKQEGMYTEAKAANYGYEPTYAKVGYDVKQLEDSDGMVLQGMSYIRAKGKIFQETMDNVLAKHIPAEFLDRFWHPRDTQLMQAAKEGSAPGLATANQPNYGTLGEWSVAQGAATRDLKSNFHQVVADKLQPLAYKLANNQELAVEFATVDAKISASAERYIWNSDKTALVPARTVEFQQKLVKYQQDLAAGKENLKLPEAPKFAEGTLPEITFKNAEAREIYAAHIADTKEVQSVFQEVRNAQGYTDMKNLDAARPIRHDLNDYPHFAIVVDPSVGGVGHKSMIHAADAKSLEAMIDKVPKNYEVYTKSQMEQFYKNHGTFDYERTLHENYINADLKSKGIDNPFFVKTDPQKIAQDWLNDRLRARDILARELVNAKFEKEFNFLKTQGEQYTSAATSKYTGSYKQIEATTANPYTNYVKTALDISQVSEHPFINGLNTLLDKQFSRAWSTVSDAFGAAKTPVDLDGVNALLEKFGMKSAYADTASVLLANHSAPKGVLSGFVRQANSILSNLTLRWDPMNALNNFLGANVMYGAETQAVIRAIQAGNKDAVGPLADLMKLDIPGLKGSAVSTHGRLMAQAYKNLVDPAASTLRMVETPGGLMQATGEKLGDFYKRIGVDVSMRDQIQQVMQDLTLHGGEDVATINTKMGAAFAKSKEMLADTAEGLTKWTGNRWAESTNRFIAADTMRQITDHAVVKGLMTESEQIGMINSFVNRTQGSIIASQRPLMFQGPVGQAIGLFQTYQFNLLQNMFRHVSEGAPKDAAMLLGLQGTLYGMNGMPAFNAINTHILGTASGNPQHTDAYSATYGVFGKQVGDLLLYGLPSNIMSSNIYTRGDINPRQVTVVPTTLADIPIVSAFTKTISNMADTFGKVSNGGSAMAAFMQGVEHNGISRPMAGLAQVAQGFSTTTKGTISYANDLFSWSSAKRIVGGKPLDEGIVNDATYRFSSYQAADHARQQSLAEAVKSSVLQGYTPTDQQLERFVSKYAASGGRQINFNKFMLQQIKSANTSQANKIMQHLQKPGAQNFQQIMGGRETPDGNTVFESNETTD